MTNGKNAGMTLHHVPSLLAMLMLAAFDGAPRPSSGLLVAFPKTDHCALRPEFERRSVLERGGWRLQAKVGAACLAGPSPTLSFDLRVLGIHDGIAHDAASIASVVRFEGMFPLIAVRMRCAGSGSRSE